MAHSITITMDMPEIEAYELVKLGRQASFSRQFTCTM